MEAPGCHARTHPFPGVAMTAALASYVNDLDLPAEPGVSTRAVRSVLRMMAKIADGAGQFRYGLRGSKLASLTEYSLSVIRRAQRYLVEHGFIERVQVGGGRASTRWRVLIHKLAPDVGSEHSSSAEKTQLPDPPDTAQERTPKLFHWIHRGSGGPRSANTSPLPPDTTTCEHGDDPRRLPSGLPRCPLCRSYQLRQDA
jgi:hypothetical protein